MLLALGVLVFWWLERSYIVSAIFFVRHYEIDLIKGVLDRVNVGLGWLNLMPIDKITNSLFGSILWQPLIEKR